jgi:hypothetical protein
MKNKINKILKNSVLLVSLLSMSAFTQANTKPDDVVKPIRGKQCVWNGGAFILNVEWHFPGAVIYTDGDVQDYKNYRVPKEPDFSKVIAVGKHSCSSYSNSTAVVSIVGEKWASNAIRKSAAALTNLSLGINVAVTCAVSDASCVTAKATAEAIKAAHPIAEIDKVAYIGVPGNKNWLDIKGTIWKPSIESSVPLRKKRNFKNTILDWITGVKPEGQSITFRNDGLFVAHVIVSYFDKMVIGNQVVPLLKTKKVGNITLGFTRHIAIPKTVDKSFPITVTILRGNNLPIKTLLIKDHNFENKCFKSWGTLFDDRAGPCD